MADESFEGVALAIGVQSAFGTENTTVSGLDSTSATDLADGFVLGDAESGTAESGITLPSNVGLFRSVAKVAASFTERADKFQKIEVNGLAISWVMQGNGSSGSVAAGFAAVDGIIPGLDAILQCAGLEAANSTSPTVQYTPRGTTIFSTIKLFQADQSFVFTDCLVESLDLAFTPGEVVIATANFTVGAFDAENDVGADLTFPTLDYEEMSSLTGPTVEGVAFAAFGQTRGFESLSISIANTVEKFGDSNVETSGQRQAQTKRVVSVTGTIYCHEDDSDAALAQLISSTAPTADLSFQVGTAVTSTADTYNAFAIEVHNLQPKDIKYNRIGDDLAVELNDSKATSTTAGEEFYLIFN
jgi:hypothetical protein